MIFQNFMMILRRFSTLKDHNYYPGQKNGHYDYSHFSLVRTTSGQEKFFTIENYLLVRIFLKHAGVHFFYPLQSFWVKHFFTLLALPQHQHTSFLCPDVSDRIALSFFKELLNVQKFLEKGQGNPVRNVGTKKSRVLVLRES